MLNLIATACIELDVRTHRAEIVVARTAKTIAAFDGRSEVTREDIKEAMELALPHRMRRKTFEQPFLEKGKIEAVMSMSNPDKNPEELEEKHKHGHEHEHKGEREQNSSSDYNSESDNPLKEKETTTIFDIGSPIDVSELKTPQGDKKYRRKIAGMTRTSEKRRRLEKLPLPACSLWMLQGQWGQCEGWKVQKGAVLSFLEDFYQHRDKIGMVAFRGYEADTLLPLCSSFDLALERLKELPTGKNAFIRRFGKRI